MPLGTVGLPRCILQAVWDKNHHIVTKKLCLAQLEGRASILPVFRIQIRIRIGSGYNQVLGSGSGFGIQIRIRIQRQESEEENCFYILKKL